MSPANSYTNKKTLRKVCIYTYTAIIPEHLFQRFGGVESTVTATGLVAVFFSAICCNSYSYMKNQIPGTLNVPASGIPTVGESVNALTEQVNNLQRRYYRALAPDCEIKTAADKWYFRAIGWTCASLVFPPLVIAVALCVYKAKKCLKGGEV